MAQPEFLISACLCGHCVRYDGGHKRVPELAHLLDAGRALAVCPEQLGGLPTPRPPCEQAGNRVWDAAGNDRTAAFEAGAQAVLELCRRYAIHTVIFKENSPSCGVHTVYDGTFSWCKISGEGMTTRLLRQHGIRVLSEEEYPAQIIGIKDPVTG